MRFVSSDAWVLQAVILASRSGPATLSDLLGAMDAIEHALPVDRELHGAFSRLTAAGYLREVDARFALTDQVPLDIVERMRVGSWTDRRSAALAFLRAEPSSGGTPWDDRANDVTYPGLTAERLKKADRDYRRRFSAEYRRLRDQEQT
jgi:hypothetical protein